MDLENYLIEAKLGTNPNTKELFDSFLKQVFTQGFINKIGKFINSIDIKEFVNTKNLNLAAYSNGYNTIFVNKPVFYKKSKTEQVAILMHEFIHLLQFNKIRQIRVVNDKLWALLNKEKKPDALISQVMLGMIVTNKKFINKDEALPYMMNEKINWQYLNDGSREKVIDLLRSSKLFQLDSKFWQERLK